MNIPSSRSGSSCWLATALSTPQTAAVTLPDFSAST